MNCDAGVDVLTGWIQCSSLNLGLIISNPTQEPHSLRGWREPNKNLCSIRTPINRLPCISLYGVWEFQPMGHGTWNHWLWMWGSFLGAGYCHACVRVLFINFFIKLLCNLMKDFDYLINCITRKLNCWLSKDLNKTSKRLKMVLLCFVSVQLMASTKYWMSTILWWKTCMALYCLITISLDFHLS